MNLLKTSSKGNILHLNLRQKCWDGGARSAGLGAACFSVGRRSGLGKGILPEVQKAEDTIVARQALASKLNCAEGRLFIHYGLVIFWCNRLSEANHRTDH